MIPQSIIYRAKTADLPFVLHSLGLNLCREGRGFFLEDHDSLKIFQKQGIWIYKWWSRSGEAGDGIQFLQRYFGMKFHEAVKTLSGTDNCANYDCSCGDHTHSALNMTSTNPWQEKAKKLVDYARKKLFEPGGADSLSFLIRSRGLSLKTVKKHNLGWLPAKDHMLSKIVIPCYSSRNYLFRIRFRTDNPKPGETRYRVMKGSNPHSSFPLGITPGKPVIIVESELDAILIHQEAGRETGVLALGTASNDLTGPVCRFLTKKIPVNLICLDNDSAGKQRTEYFLKLIPNSLSCPVPREYGKDPGEAWRFMSIRKWLRGQIRQPDTDE
ncbi:Toprim domain-containing protein [Desulfonema limicola]|uniref:Archaeal primase domain-containing protein n=1 Tax=Desulfonema limicola TaxID=45656 RepID=A0A975GE84_9BACT|nr:toprim domain-containing protein [Desulfonema limicola]QTA77813.1 archaeal primase domain-containing protein [Desulfonema limicola]QTA77822.1 archaeal primase domain-containing protein [Desulfonema limicola]QTA77835.1 archaeal primase domain-containing protein [Desulfonema limicola]QTA77852.1 archaeal primase domain-containing protein [Desulfonema limicola]QTA82964.1 Toprim domain-containing protein [Desulfonema limicola]